jgi:cathepsin C
MNLVSGGKPSTVTRVELKAPNVATTKEDQHGSWTMVYDEGFEVTVGGRNFFAFSNFTFEKDPVTNTSHNVTHCGYTQVGWYQNMDRTQFGCFYGYKTETQKAVPKSSAPAINLAKKKADVKKDTVMDHKTMTHKVDKLNKKLAMLQLGWKARVMPKWIGKTVSEINSYAGIRRNSDIKKMHMDMLKQNTKSNPRSFLQAKGIRQHMEKLPTSWDWSNVSGVNYLEPVMDQGACGSCYAASSMRMLTARHKINTKNPDALPWSINTPLFCGEYNQGCKGGYSFLISKWSRDVGLVPATCMRYNTGGSCKLECDLKEIEGKRYRVANHRYVGDFYGNSSTQAIMEELYHNGPLVVDFEPADDFMFYSDGIYKSAKPNGRAWDKTATAEEWQKVDHAVVVVGWGEEDGVKYWKIQNSWGEDWGEDGFFRMVRDENESCIESSPEAADVVEDDQNGRRVAEFFEQMNKKEL